MSRNLLLAGSLAVFGVSMGVFPYFISQSRPKSMTLDFEGALDKQRQVRGPYINVGSKDVGPDPDADKYRSAPQK
eukprot:CAMPEP_0118931628 /NCGR_PEP_ID=MMETSP1169-20130426/7904_1 /TAXON_ID=36882 /ORGANISM="Pyramimonas obovata, Strain CCMP722" /LENGTH=74 /DNA_ID=CAMNT_0006874149 /DNA_START=56 /DNA_END=280 /DNA_ORIENTATION=-